MVAGARRTSEHEAVLVAVLRLHHVDRMLLGRGNVDARVLSATAPQLMQQRHLRQRRGVRC
eukprot:297907-Prymnesium_polylepis.1